MIYKETQILYRALNKIGSLGIDTVHVIKIRKAAKAVKKLNDSVEETQVMFMREIGAKEIRRKVFNTLVLGQDKQELVSKKIDDDDNLDLDISEIKFNFLPLEIVEKILKTTNFVGDEIDMIIEFLPHKEPNA